MKEMKTGRFAVCKHPDHTDETDCGNRAIGCSKHCLCCMGKELAIELPEIKHTPAPWFIDSSATSLDIFSSDAGVLVAVVRRSLLSSHLDPTARANARLLAAAPELLEALQEIICADCRGWEELDPLLSKARAAIAKATGVKS